MSFLYSRTPIPATYWMMYQLHKRCLNRSVMKYQLMSWSSPSAHHLIHLNWVSPHRTCARRLITPHPPLGSFFPIRFPNNPIILERPSEFVYFTNFYIPLLDTTPIISGFSISLHPSYDIYSLLFHISNTFHAFIISFTRWQSLHNCRERILSSMWNNRS